jgi:hypothetical protein
MTIVYKNLHADKQYAYLRPEDDATWLNHNLASWIKLHPVNKRLFV